MAQQPKRHTPWPGNQGWGYAAFIVLLSAGCYFGAYVMHRATYRSPRDPTTLGAISHNR